MYRERYDTIIPDSDVGESVSSQPDSHYVHSEMGFVDNGKEHELPAAVVLDSLARGFDNNIITESAHEFSVHEEYVVEASLPDSGIPAKHSEATVQMPEEPVNLQLVFSNCFSYFSNFCISLPCWSSLFHFLTHLQLSV